MSADKLRLHAVVSFASVAAVLSIPAPALSCSVAMPTEHQIDTSSSDHTAPSVTRAEVISITRGKGPERQGCTGSSAGSCDDIGAVRFGLQGADDATRPEEMGWLLELDSGQLPSGMTLPKTAVRATGTDLWLHFVDGAEDEQESIGFVLRVSAVDGAGNKSAPVHVAVSHEGSGGSCAFGRNGVRWGWAIVAVAGTMMWRRRLGRRSMTS